MQSMEVLEHAALTEALVVHVAEIAEVSPSLRA